MKPLKLIAFDTEDLDVVSAGVQDAVVKVSDIAWLPKEGRFVLLLNRFAWEATDPAGKGEFQRRRAALHFDRVSAVRRRNLRQDAPDGVLNLLAVRFTRTEAPAGTIELVFSSDACIRLEVECIEARLADLGPAWSTGSCPEHRIEDAGPAA